MAAAQPDQFGGDEIERLPPQRIYPVASPLDRIDQSSLVEHSELA